MTVVVGAPDIDDAVEAALDELVAVIGDVDGVVGIKPVGAAEDFVLVRAEIGVLQPERTVLLIGEARVLKELHGLGHVAGPVQAALEEPLVKVDAVALEIALHALDVIRQTEGHEFRAALLGVDREILLPVALVDELCEGLDVVAVVAVVRELDGVLALNQLEITRLDAAAEKIDLIAGVVDIELAPDVIARAIEHGSHRVAQHAAAGVADRHRAGGVGGDELDHDLLAVAVVHAAVVRALGLDAMQHVGVPLWREAEIQEAGARDLGGGKPALREIEMGNQRLGNLSGRHAQRLGRGHGVVRGEVAVGGILRLLHAAAELALPAEFARGDGGIICLMQQCVQRLLCLFDAVHNRYLCPQYSFFSVT